MIYIVSALYIEAKFFIEKFNLKKNNSLNEFQIFENKKIKLIISGVGRVKSAIALTYLSTKFNIKENDFIFNIGFCGSLDKDKNLADIILVSKIESAYNLKKFYPDMLYKHNFYEGTLKTFDTIVENYNIQIKDGTSVFQNFKKDSEIKINNDYNVIYISSQKELQNSYIDMEAYGFFEAASVFFRKDKIIVLKVVSDILTVDKNSRIILDFNSENMNDKTTDLNSMKIEKNKKESRDILNLSFEKIYEWLLNFLEFYDEDNSDFSLSELEVIKNTRQILKLSDTMNYEFLNILKYLKLSNKNILEILKKCERIEIKNKLEGKIYFENFKKRYIK